MEYHFYNHYTLLRNVRHCNTQEDKINDLPLNFACYITATSNKAEYYKNASQIYLVFIKEKLTSRSSIKKTHRLFKRIQHVIGFTILYK